MTKPPIPEYVAECILAIANRLALKPNFSGYTYKDDMIGDAIENCIQYVDNFDPTKSKNPFAYFTQIIYYAFLRRIDKEKKQTYIKFKSLETSEAFYAIQAGHDDPKYDNTFVQFLQENLQEVVDDFEKKKAAKKDAKKKEGVEKFYNKKKKSGRPKKKRKKS